MPPTASTRFGSGSPQLLCAGAQSTASTSSVVTVQPSSCSFSSIAGTIEELIIDQNAGAIAAHRQALNAQQGEQTIFGGFTSMNAEFFFKVLDQVFGALNVTATL